MIERWGREQVLSLAPDRAARKAAGGVAEAATWSGCGCDERAVWGQCQGSGTVAYRTGADLSEPAFRCTCPSRKSPCKHALGLLVLWSEGDVGPAVPPDWVREWLAGRAERAARGREGAGSGGNGSGAPRAARRREERVEAGLAEFGRWLCDQVEQGLTAAERAPYALWDDAARRLVDAQAGTLAGQVRGLAAIPRGGAGWPRLLLEEYALMHLLVRAHQRREALPAPLRATVRARIGFTVTREEVLAGPRVRDRWYVVGAIDSEQDRVIARRVWLRGRHTGRPALVLSFSAPGRPLDATLVAGTTIDAELAFYPGAQPLRAVVADRYGPSGHARPCGTTVTGLLDEYAAAVGRDPWLDRWPVVLDGVRLGRDRHVVAPGGEALPLTTTNPWHLLSVAGGGPITVGGEWSPRGLMPLTAWHPDEGIVVL